MKQIVFAFYLFSISSTVFVTNARAETRTFRGQIINLEAAPTFVGGEVDLLSVEIFGGEPRQATLCIDSRVNELTENTVLSLGLGAEVSGEYDSEGLKYYSKDDKEKKKAFSSLICNKITKLEAHKK